MSHPEPSDDTPWWQQAFLVGVVVTALCHLLLRAFHPAPLQTERAALLFGILSATVPAFLSILGAWLLRRFPPSSE